MWSNAFATALDVRPEPSRRVAWLLCAIHGLALAGLIGVSLLAGFLALPLTGVSLVLHLRRAGWLGGCIGVARLRVEPDGTWRMMDPAGQWMRVRVSPSSYCAGGWCLLRLQGRQSRHLLVLAADSADADTLRRLRGRLLAVDADSLMPAVGLGARLKRVRVPGQRNDRDTPAAFIGQERTDPLHGEAPDEGPGALEIPDADVSVHTDHVRALAGHRRDAVPAGGTANEHVARPGDHSEVSAEIKPRCRRADG
jgi:hypothetical protein